MSGNETVAAESQGARTDDANTAKPVVPTSLSPSVSVETDEEFTKPQRTVEQRRLQNLEAQRAFRTRRAMVQGEEARLSRQWSWTTWLQNIAALAGLAALLITGFFAVRMYMLAMWTARKDAVGFCSNLEQQQSNGAQIPEWCSKVLEGHLETVPYANLHKRAFVSLSSDMRSVIRPAQQRFEPTFRRSLGFGMQFASWFDFRLVIPFLAGYSLRHYQKDPWARRWLPVHMALFICFIRIAFLIYGAAAQQFNDPTSG